MDKYISYLKGKSSGDEAYQLAMRPQQRAIGKQTAEARQDIQGYMAGQGVEGGGAAAQARLSLQQQSSEQLTNAQDSATAQLMQERRASGDKIAQTQADRITAVEDARLQTDQAFKSAKSQWKADMTNSVIQGIGSVASAGLNTMATSAASTQAAHQAALASGSVAPGTTLSDFKTSFKDSGFDNAQSYASSIGAEQTNQSIMAQGNQFLGEDKTQELLSSGYTHSDIQKEIDYARTSQQEYMKSGIQGGTINPGNMAEYYDAFGGGSNIAVQGQGAGTIDGTTNEVVGGSVNEPTTTDNLLPGISTKSGQKDIAGIVAGEIGGIGASSINMPPPEVATPKNEDFSTAVNAGNIPNPEQLEAGIGNDPFAVGGNVKMNTPMPDFSSIGAQAPLSINQTKNIKDQLAKGKAEGQLANQGVQPAGNEQYKNDALAAEQAEEERLASGSSEENILTPEKADAIEARREKKYETGSSEEADTEISESEYLADLKENLPPGEYDELQESLAGEDEEKKKTILRKWKEKRKFKKDERAYKKEMKKIKKSIKDNKINRPSSPKLTGPEVNTDPETIDEWPNKDKKVPTKNIEIFKLFNGKSEKSITQFIKDNPKYRDALTKWRLQSR